jgi:N-methylhydantoinase B/oxoprolinase/acetone carboxylase alpha subunit
LRAEVPGRGNTTVLSAYVQPIAASCLTRLEQQLRQQRHRRPIPSSNCVTFIGGRHPDRQRDFTLVEPEPGGWGATQRDDGTSAMFSGVHGGTFNRPVEVAETRYGIQVNRHAFDSNITVDRDDAVRVVTGNGAGYGDPKKRDPERARRDVQDELISREQAADIYGVVVQRFESAP